MVRHDQATPRAAGSADHLRRSAFRVPHSVFSESTRYVSTVRDNRRILHFSVIRLLDPRRRPPTTCGYLLRLRILVRGVLPAEHPLALLPLARLARGTHADAAVCDLDFAPPHRRHHVVYPPRGITLEASCYVRGIDTTIGLLIPPQRFIFVKDDLTVWHFISK